MSTGILPSANSDKVAVVTGGASGIGQAMARYFVDEGYGHVVVMDVNGLAGARVARELQEQAAAASLPGTVHYLSCDVSSWDSQATAFAEAYAVGGGRLDVVMANAGISEQGASNLVVAAIGAAEETPSQPSLRTLDVNLTGVIYTIKLATHYMRKNTRPASIICTASNSGLYPFPVAPLYAASKAAIISLVRAMQTPLEHIHVRINALAPAVIETSIATDKSMFKNMIVTPMATLIRGVDQILADPGLSGAVAEIYGDHVTFRPHHDYADAETKQNLDAFWTFGGA